MKQENDLALFVYGSLQPGESYWQRYCAGRVVGQQRARVRGRLYQLNDGYLALAQLGSEITNPKSEITNHKSQIPQLATAPWVRGWRLVLRDEAALRNIDRLEEFDPAGPSENNVYLRVRTACFADDDSEKPTILGNAWIYTMAPARLAQLGARAVSTNQNK